MEWFYEKDGAQSGPVSEDVLKGLLASGEITDRNLVWRQGMADWVPYSSAFATSASGESVCPTCGAPVESDQLIPAGDRQVCPKCRDSYAQGLKEGLTGTARLGGRGTGGMTPNSELRGIARDALSGNWGMAVVTTFLFMLVQQVAAFVPLIGVFIQWAIIGPLNIGYHRVFLDMNRGGPPDVGTAFSGFSQFLQGLGAYFVVTIIVSLAALAAAIPGGIMIGMAYMGDSVVPEENPLFILGIFVCVIPVMCVSIYMYLRYCLVYFLASDHPEMGVFQLIGESKQRMDGHKKKLFFLFCSYIPWYFLGLLAFFIGILWSMTYAYAGFAAFYDDLGEDA